jgi:hypothetical protein
MPNTVRIGEILQDDWVVAGISPKTNRPFSVEPSRPANEKQQFWFAAGLRNQFFLSLGFVNPRLPSLDELRVMYDQRAALSFPANLKKQPMMVDHQDGEVRQLLGTYWSSDECENKMCARVFNMGSGLAIKDDKAMAHHFIRSIRDEPHLHLKM